MKTSEHVAGALLTIFEAENEIARLESGKSQALERMEKAKRLKGLGVKAYGVRHDRDGECWKRWYLFTDRTPNAPSARATREAIENPNDITNGDYLERLVGALWLPSEGWGGPGQVFEHRPHVRATGTRILVTQTGGWDI